MTPAQRPQTLTSRTTGTPRGRPPGPTRPPQEFGKLRQTLANGFRLVVKPCAAYLWHFFHFVSPHREHTLLPYTAPRFSVRGEDFNLILTLN